MMRLQVVKEILRSHCLTFLLQMSSIVEMVFGRRVLSAV